MLRAIPALRLLQRLSQEFLFDGSLGPTNHRLQSEIFFSFFSYFSEDKLLAPPTVRSEPLCAVKGAFSFSTRTGDKQAVK